MSKTCSHCRSEKPLSEFHRLSSSLDGHQPRCKACIAEYSKRRYASDPERFKSYETAKRRASGVQPKQVGRDPAKQERYGRLSNARRYGLTLKEYDALLAAGCAICGRTKNANGRRLHIDHCHDTGKVRGALCHYCNVGLGQFGDDQAVMEKALTYLKDASTEGASAA